MTIEGESETRFPRPIRDPINEHVSHVRQLGGRREDRCSFNEETNACLLFEVSYWLLFHLFHPYSDGSEYRKASVSKFTG